MYNSRKKSSPRWVTFIRIVLGLVFVSSGFLKGIDPWGTAIKTGEYLTAFGMEGLSGAAMTLAIGQCALEMWLGLLLLLNRLRGFTRFFTLLFMLFFTVLTLITALTDPVSDCGCFGDAIKLTNWQTFYKNIVLLPLSFALFLHLRREIPTDRPRAGLVTGALMLALLPPLMAVYSLPWIDFLPYRVGTNLPAAMYVAPEDRGQTRTTLLYKELESGDTHEFELTDTTWQDSSRWEFVDTRTIEISKGKEPAITNFVIFNRTDDVTEEILAEEEVFLLIADRIDAVGQRDLRRFARITAWTRAHGIRTVCLTTSPLEESASFRQTVGPGVECYNIDATTLKTLLRAHRGLVILERGTILAKRNLRQTPRFETTKARSGLEFVLARMRAGYDKSFVTLYILLITALGVIAYKRCKN